VLSGGQGQDDKIRVVLNKADQVNSQQLMRVYGAMMWSLGKVIRTPEVVRVYVGSFWDEPYKNKDNEKLFQAEQADLIRDLRNLPANSTIRKVNEIVKRSRLLRVHAHIISYLRTQMPSMFGKSSKQEELINNMREVFQTVQRQYNLPMVRGGGGRALLDRADAAKTDLARAPLRWLVLGGRRRAQGDFPDVQRFQENCTRFDFSKHFQKLNPKMMQDMDQVLSVDLPELMKRFPQDQPSKNLGDLGACGAGGAPAGGRGALTCALYPRARALLGDGGAAERAAMGAPEAPLPPAGGGAAAGGSAGHVDVFAVTEGQRERYIANFNAADPNDEGKLTGAQAKEELLKSGLDKEMLKRIWFLADQDRDGMLDLDEYIIAVHLAKVRRPAGRAQPGLAQWLTYGGARLCGRVFSALAAGQARHSTAEPAAGVAHADVQDLVALLKAPVESLCTTVFLVSIHR